MIANCHNFDSWFCAASSRSLLTFTEEEKKLNGKLKITKVETLLHFSEKNDDQPSILTYAEVKTIVKTKWNNDWKKNHLDYSTEKDAMHSMEREQQKTIFRLRTGHGCLRAHLHKQGKSDSPYCNCGPVAQTPHQVLQDCPLLDGLQEEIWPTPTSIETKLWDSGKEELKKTTTFLKRAGINT